MKAIFEMAKVELERNRDTKKRMSIAIKNSRTKNRESLNTNANTNFEIKSKEPSNKSTNNIDCIEKISIVNREVLYNVLTSYIRESDRYLKDCGENSIVRMLVVNIDKGGPLIFTDEHLKNPMSNLKKLGCINEDIALLAIRQLLVSDPNITIPLIINFYNTTQLCLIHYDESIKISYFPVSKNTSVNLIR